MSAITNRATHEYRTAQDKAVKAELIAAGIPVLQLPIHLSGEVKTSYIGLLNGFVFWRAWRYWVCSGDMPLAYAKEIYRKYHTLMVRAEGHAGNIEPEGYDPELEQKQEALAAEMFARGACATEVVAAAEHLDNKPDSARYVRQYHIDTTEGLEALAQYIKENSIYAHNGKNGTYQQNVFPW